ncbi:hypothetical protein POM88_050766 [Heracleum sosnowskyi]|uniref:ATP-dependent DNA helicase n=1 Tax=Heracleum sosnowskyi TaxID=360622 RepID=A0AAD8M0P7_9APIA|nr:hypothetical protein POM88_050766 [Heracleum sosnowskyi]
MCHASEDAQKKGTTYFALCSDSAAGITVHDIGSPDQVCGYCTAQVWAGDGRFVNLPGGLAIDNNFVDTRDILVDYKQTGLKHINELHPCFMSLQYPLLFPAGEDGFRLGIKHCDKLMTPKDIDTIISAELPDKETDVVGYEAVSQFMMHGPCGEANPKCPCMVLPVLPKEGHEVIVAASISKSYLWQTCTIYQLFENMRLEEQAPPITLNGKSMNFRDWILRLGDGTEPTYALDDDIELTWIPIPKEMQMEYSGDPVKAIVDEIYGTLQLNHRNIEYLRDRAILTPLNTYVAKINEEALDRLHGDATVYTSCDSICKASVTSSADEVLYPT